MKGWDQLAEAKRRYESCVRAQKDAADDAWRMVEEANRFERAARRYRKITEKLEAQRAS